MVPGADPSDSCPSGPEGPGQVAVLRRQLAAARGSAERHRRRVKALGEGIARVSPGGDSACAKGAADALFGLPRGGLTGRSLREFSDGPQLDPVSARTRRRHADGGRRRHRSGLAALVDDAGQPVGVEGISHDISERRREGTAVRVPLALQRLCNLVLQTQTEGNWPVLVDARRCEPCHLVPFVACQVSPLEPAATDSCDLVTLDQNAHPTEQGSQWQPATTLGARLEAAGRWVCRSVRDDGGGVRPEVLPVAFDPFFTTKPTGRWSVLGLSVSRAIVPEHGGVLEADSQPREGVAFRALLPVAAAEGECTVALGPARGGRELGGMNMKRPWSRSAPGVLRWALVGGLLLGGMPTMADDTTGQDRQVMAPASWRQQALQQVMPPWLEHGRDREHGGFHTGLTREWQPTGSSDRYPTMVGRHLYSLSAAYLLGGGEPYLELARQTADWLMRYGWDARYGGWYRSVSVTGVPVDTVKDAFTQMYATTGLALYCLVTRDPRAWQCLEAAHRIMQDQAWDSLHGGYYVELNRDLSVRRDQKSFNPQIGLLSSYMLYHYLSDPTPAHLAQMQRDMDLALDHMRTPEQGLVRDDFARDWVCLPRQQEGTEFLSAGGNIETAWVLMRLYGLTGRESYRQTALELAAAMQRWAWDGTYGGWYPGFARIAPEVHGTAKVWFIQAYGNFMALYAYRLTRDPAWLDYFRRTAVFWNQYLLDPVYGGDYISVDRVGRLLDGTKANSSKGSYHTMEHALLNYLYLSLFVQRQPATLHFHVGAERAPGDLYVCPVEDPDIALARVQLNGRPWTAFDGRRRSVRLPDGDCLLTVELVDGR